MKTSGRGWYNKGGSLWMREAISRNGVRIRLTDERWQHITSRHPEMHQQTEKVLQTVSEPDMIQAGDFGEQLAIRFIARHR